jgi:predicted TIM-barrel fold metal-dependent hydrolase
VIDVHAHVFNLRYVPVVGILRGWGVESVLADALAAIFIAITETDPSLDRRVRSAELTRSVLIRQIARMAPLELALDSRVLRALDPGEQGSLAISQLLEKSATARRKVFEGIISRLVRRGVDAMRVGVGGLRLVWLMMHRERDIVNHVVRTYPDVTLFVHQMMDMEKHYCDPPAYEFITVQIPRMRRLAIESGGRLLGFVAYSPLREKPVEVVQLACASGFVGVKFYPPSGYRPIGNAGMLPDGDLIDQRNLELFRYCQENGVPVLAHCTPGGFEAGEGFGCYSDPDGWETLLQLEEFRSLRLCLGHAGGGSGWFASNTPEGDGEFNDSYAGKVYRLCSRQDFPNVYCDMSYLAGVLNRQLACRMARRLEKVLSDNATFGRRMMYGSDWHMLFQEDKCERYYLALERMFEDSAILKQYRQQFFLENAKAFLHLGAYLARGR